MRSSLRPWKENLCFLDARRRPRRVVPLKPLAAEDLGLTPVLVEAGEPELGTEIRVVSEWAGSGQHEMKRAAPEQ
jgi:hypothetical protein